MKVIKVNEYDFKPLTSAEDIRQAEKLLYDVYVLEQGWRVVPNNPSNIVVKQCEQSKYYYLTDSYSSKADWYGAVKQGVVVGCFRVLPPKERELERYFSLPPHLMDTKPCELNRLAIGSEYRHSTFITLILKRIAFDHAFSLSHTAYVTAEPPRLSNLYLKLGLTETGIRFKYTHDESNMIELLYGQFHNRHDSTLYKLTNKYMT